MTGGEQNEPLLPIPGPSSVQASVGAAPRPSDRRSYRRRLREDRPPGFLRAGAYLCFVVAALGGLGFLLGSEALALVSIWISQPPLGIPAFLDWDLGVYYLLLAMAWCFLIWPALWFYVLRGNRRAWYAVVVSTLLALTQWLILMAVEGGGDGDVGLWALALLAPLVQAGMLVCLVRPSTRQFIRGRVPFSRDVARETARTFE